MKARLVQVFNTYRFMGGEEASVHRIYRHVAETHSIRQCLFDSRDWVGAHAPGPCSQALRMWYNPDSLRVFRQAVDEERPDAVLLHNLFPVASAGIYRECVRRELPMIQFVHNFRPFSVNGHLWARGRVEPAGLRRNFLPEILAGSWQNSRLKTAWYGIILSALHGTGVFRKVRAWVGISEFMRKTFVEAGFPEDKVYALPHAWDIREPRSEASRQEGYYLFLGRLSEMKGLRVLLRAWARLYQEMGGSTPRLYIGGEGDMETVVQDAASRNPALKILGHVNGEHKRTLIRGCKAMIAPSIWWEPLGLVTYEAYEYQKPMLAASSGGLTETVVDGETGFLHSPGNDEELYRQVIQLEENDGLAERMGKKGREWLELNTTKEKWKGDFNRILEDVCGWTSLEGDS